MHTAHKYSDICQSHTHPSNVQGNSHKITIHTTLRRPRCTLLLNIAHSSKLTYTLINYIHIHMHTPLKQRKQTHKIDTLLTQTDGIGTHSLQNICQSHTLPATTGEVKARCITHSSHLKQYTIIQDTHSSHMTHDA